MQLPTTLFVLLMTVLALVGNIYCRPTIVNDAESRDNTDTVLSQVLRRLLEARARRMNYVSIHCVGILHVYSMQAPIHQFIPIEQRFNNNPCGRQNPFMLHLEVLCKQTSR